MLLDPASPSRGARPAAGRGVIKPGPCRGIHHARGNRDRHRRVLEILDGGQHGGAEDRVDAEQRRSGGRVQLFLGFADCRTTVIQMQHRVGVRCALGGTDRLIDRGPCVLADLSVGDRDSHHVLLKCIHGRLGVCGEVAVDLEEGVRGRGRNQVELGLQLLHHRSPRAAFHQRLRTGRGGAGLDDRLALNIQQGTHRGVAGRRLQGGDRLHGQGRGRSQRQGRRGASRRRGMLRRARCIRLLLG